MLRKNSVPDQNADNLFKTTRGELGCCGDNAVECENTASYTQANSVSALNVTELGVAKTISLTIAGAASAATVKTAIEAALIAEGYYEDDDPDFPGVTVTDQGSTLDVVLTGDVVPVSLVTSGGTVNFTSKCTKTGTCTFAKDGFTAGAGSTLHGNGASASIGDITPGTTTAGTVKTSVETALGTLGITYSAVTVTTTGSGGSQTYNVTIAGAPAQSTFYLVGASGVKFYLVRSACVQVFA
jgi:hypothetical protein